MARSRIGGPPSLFRRWCLSALGTGINANGLRFLLLAQRQGADFSRVAMLGRQGIHISFDRFADILRREFGVDQSLSDLRAIHGHFYAEKLFRLLGAHEVISVDASSYEGADIVHDFNAPIPDELKRNFSLVFDGGTLEHVFFFTTALRNAMEMVCVGGGFIGVSPANNEMGHGFYQISPELYFRALNPRNGFALDQMYLHEGRESRRWFRVADPDAIVQRVTLLNTRPTLLSVRATCQSDQDIFATPPQQSDYSRAWSAEDSANSRTTEKRSALRRMLHFLPIPFKRAITIARVQIRERLIRRRMLAGGGHDRRGLVPFDPVVAARETEGKPVRLGGGEVKRT